MFTKTIFGAVKSTDGWRVEKGARNTIRIQRGSTRFYVFVEPLNTDPVTYQIDRSGAFSDSRCIGPLNDARLSAWAISAAIEYFALKGVEVC